MNDSPKTPSPEDPAAEPDASGAASSDELAELYNQGSPAGSPTAGKPASIGPIGGDELGAKMTFLEHLDELRKRILYAASAVALGFLGSWFFREQLFAFLAIPITDVLQGPLVFTKPTEPFSIYLKVSFVAGIFLASPILLLQLWIFIAPGLYRREKSYAVPFMVSSTSLFILGGVFAYYIILPTALDFLINQFGRNFQPMVSAIEYFNFEVIIVIGMGVIFQLPVLSAFLSIFGFITPGFLWRNFRYAFLLIVIVAAVVSPTADILNLFLWSGPMMLLYMISIGVSWVFQRRRARDRV